MIRWNCCSAWSMPAAVQRLRISPFASVSRCAAAARVEITRRGEAVEKAEGVVDEDDDVLVDQNVPESQARDDAQTAPGLAPGRLRGIGVERASPAEARTSPRRV